MRKLIAVVGLFSAVVIAAPPAGADTSKDKAIAKKAVLQRSDLPAGWRDAGKQRSEESGAPECKKFDRESRTVKKIPHADSREFSDSSDPQQITQVSNTVAVFPNSKAAKRSFSVFASDDIVNCLQAVGEKATRKDAPGATVSVQDINVVKVGDAQTGRSIVLTGTDGSSVNIDFVLVRVGRGVVEFS